MNELKTHDYFGWDVLDYIDYLEFANEFLLDSIKEEFDMSEIDATIRDLNDAWEHGDV